jgi:hypothetical protein
MCFKPNIRYWLLLGALTFVFTLCIAMKLGVTNIQTLNQLLIYDDFDLKLQEFK